MRRRNRIVREDPRPRNLCIGPRPGGRLQIERFASHERWPAACPGPCGVPFRGLDLLPTMGGTVAVRKQVPEVRRLWLPDPPRGGSSHVAGKSGQPVSILGPRRPSRPGSATPVVHRGGKGGTVRPPMPLSCMVTRVTCSHRRYTQTCGSTWVVRGSDAGRS